MIWKCCTQYASKFGKLSSSHRTGKGQFSSRCQGNAQTIAQLHSSHKLTKWCSKFSKSGFKSMWTMNFQMFKLDLEKAEEPEIKLLASVGSSKRQESSRKTSTTVFDYPKAFVDHNKLWKTLKEMGHYFANKGLPSQGYCFSSSYVWMWELDYKESWVPKNWGFWAMVLEKTLESPLDCKEIQPVELIPKRDQSWVFIGRTHAEAETPILWPPDVNNWLIWKDPDAGKDWNREVKGMTEDEMVGWHHQLDGHEFV